jgi:hypothetical protein
MITKLIKFLIKATNFAVYLGLAYFLIILIISIIKRL